MPQASILETLSTVRSHGGTQSVLRHASAATGTPMTFAVFVPDHDPGETLPVLIWLSGLTCTHANVMEKGEYGAACAQHRIIFVAPDTSPRGESVPDDPDGAWDFGLGAGFYVDATQSPWSANYRMKSYIEDELAALLAAAFPVADLSRQSIAGHSMGGHGALTIALRNPGRFASCSAFAPIVSPLNCPWGEKALGTYIGADRAGWRQYDTCALLDDGARFVAANAACRDAGDAGEILVDIGTADPFLADQLKPELLGAAATRAGQPLILRHQPGYDHSYYFIATFMPEHIAWHAERLSRPSKKPLSFRGGNGVSPQ